MRQEFNNSIGILQANLISNLKTNNLILDIILGFFIMTVINKISNLYFNLRFYDKIRKYIEKLFHNDAKNEIILIRKEFLSTTNIWKLKLSYPKQLLAIYNYIHKNDILKNGSMTYIETKEKLMFSDINYVINSNEPIQLTNDIYFKKLYNIDGEVIVENNKGDKTKEHQYSLYSHNKSLKALKEFLNDILDTLEKDIIYDLNKKSIYYMFDQKIDGVLSFDEYSLENERTFENVFFDEKKDLIERLDFFINNREWYKKKGIPYTLGIMFSGKPGCGKTSTIKAIAKYTNRHIIDIPLAKIESCRDLMNIFYNEEINDKVIPMNKRIYLFEDIDSILDILKERESEVKSEEKSSDKNLELIETLLNKKQIIQKENDKLNLGFFLNLIDGVLETPGRILIISTNYPEKLDKALIRPGRIDIKIHLEKCSETVIKDIFNHYYDLDTGVIDEYLVRNFYNKEITPAELYVFCFKYTTFDKMKQAIEREGFDTIFSQLINRNEKYEFNKNKLFTNSNQYIKEKIKNSNYLDLSMSSGYSDSEDD